MDIKNMAQKFAPEIIAYRRWLHRHPELGGEEVETSAFVAEELKKMGIEVKTGYAKTGIQGMIYGKNPKGKTIMIRADMDALPIEELAQCDFKSENPGRMHACGHDAHTAAVLGAAKILSEIKDELNGNVKFCFQPAEEAVGGADLMVEHGILENPKVDYSIGMHVDPKNSVGSVAVEAGPISSYPDFFEIKIVGKGGHGSFPSKCIDPILPAVEAYHMINSIPKKISPLEPCVVQVCVFQSGTATASIPDSVLLAGTARTHHVHNREIVKNSMGKIVKCIEDLYGVQCTLDYRGHCFPVYNMPEFIPKVKKSLEGIFEKGFVTSEIMKMGGEDYCYYTKYVPSTFLIVGSANEDKNTQYALHNQHFCLDEKVIINGAAAFSQIAYDYLNGEYE